MAGEHRQLGELLGEPLTPEAFPDTLPVGLDECVCRHCGAWQQGSSCALDNDAARYLSWVDGYGHGVHLARFVHTHIGSIDGVRRTESTLGVNFVKHDYRMARIVG